ncbi:single-stranded DNA-binding protein [Merismopedia glauca]|uniref:Uncharacterized protein n=1 Tax=Merismopedia glauca CCAP 1448/3 TaxID=1296344 RepID=A0A2T1BWV4_9CYAN|nr:single-stranded DNA-binding protein [Merismopedia glauca]PSB00403.1 hypothetical protein C7B64_23705 [Merismopedia glauca CCAP 1448/3]
MTPQQIDLLLEIQHRQMVALEKIAITLEKLTPNNAPNYQYPLESFKTFNWQSISATVEQTDNYGATVVTWSGQQYIRRSPANKFEPAIWFSRCTKKKEDGTNEYERLITFKSLSQTEVEPLPQKVNRIIG